MSDNGYCTISNNSYFENCTLDIISIDHCTRKSTQNSAFYLLPALELNANAFYIQTQFYAMTVEN